MNGAWGTKLLSQTWKRRRRRKKRRRRRKTRLNKSINQDNKSAKWKHETKVGILIH